MFAEIVRHIVSDLRFTLREIELRLHRRISIDHTLLQTLDAVSPCVTVFQKRFNQCAWRYGIQVPVTGVYDADTQSAVTLFQKLALYVLNGDGFVGPVTAHALRIKLLGE